MEPLTSTAQARVFSAQVQERNDRTPSPVDWRNEVLYFLLPDRFSDGQDGARPLLDRTNLAAGRPAGFTLAKWAESGGSRFQGGTIAGITSRLDYLQTLGVTTLWVGPV